MKYLITLLVIIVLLSETGCGKGCVEAQYNFTMQEIFYPGKDSILVGDTLFMESSHSTTFNDTLTNKLIDFSSSDIGGSIGLFRLPDSSTTVVGGMNDFSILILKGTAVGKDYIPSENKQFLFVESNNKYVLKLGLVAKEKGTYAVSLGNSIGIIKKRGGCEKANILITNGNVSNHLYFYINFFRGLPISEYTKTHVYCFKVI